MEESGYCYLKTRGSLFCWPALVALFWGRGEEGLLFPKDAVHSICPISGSVPSQGVLTTDTSLKDSDEPPPGPSLWGSGGGASIAKFIKPLDIVKWGRKCFLAQPTTKQQSVVDGGLWWLL